MRIDEVMDTDVAVCEPYLSLAQVAAMMAIHEVEALPVVRQGKLIGMVCERDIVVRGLAVGLEPAAPVTAVVGTDRNFCMPHDSLDDVIDLMCARQLMRLPVTDVDGMLVGIVELRHLVASDRSLLLTWRPNPQ